MRRRTPPFYAKRYPLLRVGITLTLTFLVGSQVISSYSRPRLPDPKREPPVVVPTTPNIPPLSVENTPAPKGDGTLPVLGAKSAILIDAQTGQVLYEHDADTPRPIASTTKVMTALLLCEHTRPEDMIVASKFAAETKESSLHLKAGEAVSSYHILRAVLMRSANDACVAVAEHLAHTEAEFAQMMNARASELGATHTHFVNSHGLHNKEHFSSARDLALIGRVAIQEPRIEEVVRTKMCRIERSLDKKDVTLRNHSRFLGKFPGADGIKTGWTIPAGKCFVGSATQNGWRLIAVVLNTKDYIDDTSRLMKYGFENFQPKSAVKAGDMVGTCAISNGEQEKVNVVAKQGLQVISRKGMEQPFVTRLLPVALNAPVNVGAVVGTLELLVDGKPVCSTPVLAQATVLPIKGVSALLHGNPRGKFWTWAMILSIAVVSLRYGTRVTSITKSTLRRWRRIAKSLRSHNSGW